MLGVGGLVVTIFHKCSRSLLTGSNKNFSISTFLKCQSKDVFTGDSDRFNGITIDSSKQNSTVEKFPKQLNESLTYWKENSKRGIWFKVHNHDSYWVPELTKQGFNFHHAKKSYVMMFKWLPTTEKENIPVFAHSMLGVGGLVMNSKNEVLVVSEKFPLIPNSWKLPGGYVEPSEDIYNAAIREVFEETGIKTKFKSIVAFRHSHHGNFDCSELYMIIALEPLTHKIVPCEREIAKAAWMPVDEYLECPQVFETNREFVRLYLENKKVSINMTSETRIHQYLKKSYQLYFLQKYQDE